MCISCTSKTRLNQDDWIVFQRPGFKAFHRAKMLIVSGVFWEHFYHLPPDIVRTSSFAVRFKVADTMVPREPK